MSMLQPVPAEQPSGGYQIAPIFDFSAGLNLMAPADNLASSELQVARNIDLYSRGGFARRRGIVEHRDLETTDRVHRYIEFEYLDGSGVKHLRELALVGTELRELTTGTALATGLNAQFDYEIFKYKLYFLSNGKYMVYDGTTCADVAPASGTNLDKIKKCKYITQRGVRLFAAGNPDEPTVLYYSEQSAPNNFPAVNIVEAITDDADGITGLADFHGALVVFKSRSIFAWFGFDPKSDVEFVKIPSHTGTIAHRTICPVGNMLFFLGENGVYALQGTYKDVIATAHISAKVTPLFGSIPYSSDGTSRTACAVYYDNKYLLSFPSDTVSVNDRVLVFYGDRIFQDGTAPCVEYSGWNIGCWWNSFIDGRLYSGSSATGIIQKHDDEVWTDLGEPIEIDVLTAPMEARIGEFVKNKKYRRGYLILKQYEEHSSTVTIECYIDYIKKAAPIDSDESLVWDMRDWGTSRWGFIDVVTRRFKLGHRGKRLTMRFTDSTPGNRLEIYGVALEYKIKKPDRR